MGPLSYAIYCSCVKPKICGHFWVNPFPFNPSFGPSSRPRNRSRNLLPSRTLKPNSSNKVRLQDYGMKYREECSCNLGAGTFLFFICPSPRSLHPFYIVTYSINCVNTSCTYCIQDTKHYCENISFVKFSLISSKGCIQWI